MRLSDSNHLHRLRFPLLFLAVLALLYGIWAGLLRLGWNWPVLRPTLPLSHGPLMVCGFLGTLVSLERAVALRRAWTYLGPLFSGLGGIVLIWNSRLMAGPILITLGSLWLVLIFLSILRQHRAGYILVMALGATCWLAGSLFWLFGQPVYQVVLWWAGFLVLTIAGERLELSRVRQLSRRSQAAFLAICATIIAGLALMTFALRAGMRLTSAAFLALAIWLLTCDIARRTVRKSGLTRFIAVSLLSGYAWLGIGGLWGAWQGGYLAGPIYDIHLHTIFLGFVFGMIFGHAPIILPAVLGISIQYTPWLYAPAVLLHASLLLRVAGGLSNTLWMRQWGGVVNGLAILAYFALMISTALRQRRQDST